MVFGEDGDDNYLRGQGWFKARACAPATCVEVRFDSRSVKVRDSKDLSNDPTAPFPFIDVPIEKWPLFLSEVLGESPPGSNGSIYFTEEDGGDVTLTCPASDVALKYDAEEWRVFRGGILEGDFGPCRAPAIS